jgi:hypothetical protein
MDLARRPTFSFEPGALRAHAIRDQTWGFDGDGNAMAMEITIAE